MTINSDLAGGGFTIAQRGTGSLTIDGGTVLLDGQSATARPGITVAELEGSTGTLSITNGGSLVINRSSPGEK